MDGAGFDQSGRYQPDYEEDGGSHAMKVFNHRLKPALRGTGFSLWTALLAAALFAIPAFAQLDLSGEWAPRFHEDQPERIPGPEIGDYLGLPINDAARMRGDIWDADLLTLPEHQCKPHPSDYGVRGPANLRIWKEVDTAT